MQKRLETLQRLHRELDQRIASLGREPSACSVSLYAMKRDRLRLRDKIVRLGRQAEAA